MRTLSAIFVLLFTMNSICYILKIPCSFLEDYMINFILYENDEDLKRHYQLIILNFLGNREEKFKISNYEDANIQSCNRNIYILSSDNQDKLLLITKEIRYKHDWNSQIIIISNLNSINHKFLTSNLLILNYIDKNDNLIDNLKKSIIIAYKTLTKERTLDFLLNGEVYCIPYHNIQYIEKGNNQNHCTIYTIYNNEYIIKDTINNLEKQLDATYFMKTHRSCIVNLFNIIKYDCHNNTIIFDGNKTDLIAREKRQILKARLIEKQLD